MTTRLTRRWLLAALAATGIGAAAMPPGIRLDDKGTFRFGEAEFVIQTYNAGWSPFTNGSWSDRKVERGADGSFTLTGKMKVSGITGDVTEIIRSTGKDSFTVECKTLFPSPAQVNAIHGALIIPAVATTITVDGKERQLPAEYKDMMVFHTNNAKSMTITLAGGRVLTVTGSPLKIAIQDNRKFGGETFSIRFPFTPSSGKITESALSLGFRAESAVSQPIDIRSAANRGFADDRPENPKVGWTGQGKENDLRMIKPGPVEFESLRFEIIDQNQNNGNGSIVLGGKAQAGMEQTATVNFPEGTTAGALNLLHAAAWLPVGQPPFGEIEVTFADGSSQTIPVVTRRDIGNWWGAYNLENAWVTWMNENEQAKIGLYASSFPLQKNNPRSARFRVLSERAMWMIPAVTLSSIPIRFAVTEDKELTIKENRQWIPLEFNRETVKGSALDFSFLQDAPAGKYGFIQASPDGRLTFRNAPDKTIRLYGPNLCFSAGFLDKETVDKMAETFVRLGYNTVRIHHHDTEMLDPKAPDTLTFDPAKIDQLDYLFYRMKESGIYIVTDFYTNRTFKPGDNIPECDFYDQRQMKMLAPISKAALDNWKEFARRWMTHKNPYTGLAWNEDPALFCVNLVNEEVLAWQWNRSPKAAELYIKRFNVWKQENHCPDAQPNEGDRHFRKFLQELQEKCLAEQLRFAKEDLKMQAMVTSLNYTSHIPLALLRDKFDLVDNHAYFDHPGFLEKQWSAPFKYSQGCAMEQYAQVPRLMMPSRIFGKPFIVTEFNYCYPNRFRAEAGPLIGAYSALQNWDGLYRFAWSHGAGSIRKLSGVGGFDAVNDPFAQLSDRIAVLMFRRGDVAPSANRFAWDVASNFFEGNDPLEFPMRFQRLGLISQIGSSVNGRAPKGVDILKGASTVEPSKLGNRKVADLWQKLISDKVAVSDTGELRLDVSKPSFTVATPRSESVTLASGSLTAGTLSVRNAECFQTVAALSLDGRPIAESASVLVIQLTNLYNTGAHFGNERLTVFRGYGSRPLLVFRGRSTVELATASPFKVTALGADGQNRGEVAGKLENGKFRFTADPGCFPGGVMAYHLTR